MLQVITNILPEDFRAFSREVARRGAAGSRAGRLGFAIGAGLFFGLVLGIGSVGPARILDPLTMLFTAVFLVLFLIVLTRRMRSGFAPLPGGSILGEKTITLSDEGIRSQGAYTESFVQWPAVLDLLETRQHLFVMIDRPAGVIIPKRCFASDLECHEFAEALRLHAGGTYK
jgi:YcxB-like protein